MFAAAQWGTTQTVKGYFRATVAKGRKGEPPNCWTPFFQEFTHPLGEPRVSSCIPSAGGEPPQLAKTHFRAPVAKGSEGEPLMLPTIFRAPVRRRHMRILPGERVAPTYWTGSF